MRYEVVQIFSISWISSSAVGLLMVGRLMKYPWSLYSLLTGKPTVGGLMDLCEENYHHLMRLLPTIKELSGCHCSEVNGHISLYLDILEQTPYTTLVHLTYYFSHESGATPDPDATVRIYHDSHQAEVLDLRQSALPLKRGWHHPALEQKWRANMFLSKWLSFCARQAHCFRPVHLSETLAADSK